MTRLWLKILGFILVLWIISMLVGCERTFAGVPYQPSSMPVALAPTGTSGNIGFAGFDRLTHEHITIEVWVDIVNYGKAENRGYVMFYDLPYGKHKYIARSDGYGFTSDEFFVSSGEVTVFTILMDRSDE